ncbi:hypothetical protein [Aureimonas ureilytica]|uniref:hypothetical protein n=1 Tax=Aureimonas ureilytica TaxID=401562 RepID=UPI000B295F54|nr:hypothetical protein [Aureimonas ureilytica]
MGEANEKDAERSLINVALSHLDSAMREMALARQMIDYVVNNTNPAELPSEEQLQGG